MKRLLLILVAFATLQLSVNAQNFEGTMKYDIKYSGETVAQFASMMPNSYTLKVKGNNSRFAIQGGMVSSFMGDVISMSDKELAYILMPSQKTAYKISTKEEKGSETIKPTVVNTGVSETINGYKCTKYKISFKSKEGEMTSYMWASKDLAVKFPKSTMQGGALSAYEGVDGFPVKVEQNVNQMGMSFTMTVVLNEAKKGAIADAEFTVPSDYKVQEGLPDFGGMMGGK
jgi:hypothetical protein